MKKLIGVIGLLLLAGCEPYIKVDSGDWALPSDLRDCHVIELHKGGSSSMALIIKCPDGYIGSTLNYQSGKNKYSVSTVVM